MKRGYVIALVSVLLVIVVGIGVGIGVNSGRQQPYDYDAEAKASDEAANRVLNAAGVTIENGVVVNE